MRVQIFTIAVACCFAVACGSARKSQTSTPSTTTAPASSVNTANAKPGDYEMLDAETYKLTGVSDDATYGYSAKNAIKVGAGGVATGPASERMFLNALKGPGGEKISYARRGSCCGVESSHAPLGVAMLDIYEIKYKGLDKPVILYVNMYDPGVLQAPKGFTFRQ